MASVHHIPTDNYDVILSFKVIMDRPVILRIKGYDAHSLHPNSVYFDRVFGVPGSPVKGVKVVKAPLPISPAKLSLIAYDDVTGSQAGIRVEEVKVYPLDKKIIAFHTPEDYEFFRFLEEFVKVCGYSPPGEYKSKSGKFKIFYSNAIYGKDNKELATPGRVFYPHGEMEFCKPKFDKYTIPIRMFLGLHERCHFRLKHGLVRSRNHNVLKQLESQADRYAMGLFMGMGYPKSEGVYAFTKVFTPVNEKHAQDLLERMEDAVSFIKQF